MNSLRSSGLSRTRGALGILSVCCVWVFLFASTVHADSVYSVTVQTTGLTGTSAQLAFDFIDGGLPSNTVTIASFSTDGTLGAASLTGGAAGLLPGTVSLTDSSFFNEYLTNITLGTRISLILDATSNGPLAVSIPDAFSLFLLDPTTGLPLFTTTDPTGADSLFFLNIDGSSSGGLDVYSAPGGEASVSITPVSSTPLPEPSSLLLTVVSMGLLVSSIGSFRGICGLRRRLRPEPRHDPC